MIIYYVMTDTSCKPLLQKFITKEGRTQMNTLQTELMHDLKNGEKMYASHK